MGFPLLSLIVCISMAFCPPSHTLFRDAIEEIYNKDASLSIHLKKQFIYSCAWPALPYRIVRVGHFVYSNGKPIIIREWFIIPTSSELLMISNWLESLGKIQQGLEEYSRCAAWPFRLWLCYSAENLLPGVSHSVVVSMALHIAYSIALNHIYSNRACSRRWYVTRGWPNAHLSY
jgi:hypothetical protein